MKFYSSYWEMADCELCHNEFLATSGLCGHFDLLVLSATKQMGGQAREMVSAVSGLHDVSGNKTLSWVNVRVQEIRTIIS